MGKHKQKCRAKPKERLSLRDAVMPAAVLTLASIEQGSQGNVPVLEELTSYVVDDYETGGASGALQQVGVGLSDLVTGAISTEGIVILGGGLLVRHYLGRHGKRITIAKTAHHRIAVGG